MKPNRGQCPAELKDYLDQEMPGWRTYVKSHKGVVCTHISLHKVLCKVHLICLSVCFQVLPVSTKCRWHEM